MAEGAEGHNWPGFNQALAGNEFGEGDGEEQVAVFFQYCRGVDSHLPMILMLLFFIFTSLC